MSRHMSGLRDGTDERREQWLQQLPDLDTTGMALLGRMRWITLKVRQDIEAVFDAHGLDSGEFDVLATLLRAGEPHCLRPTELYRSLMISSGGLTDRLNRLDKTGLIKREPCPDDARSMLVRLTPDGKRTAEAAFRADMQLESVILASLNDADKAKLEKLLRKLVLSIEER